MTSLNYFKESIPDGLTNAILAFDKSIECCNQDSYELLISIFGRNVSEADLKNATEQDFQNFAQSMKELFELTTIPSVDVAKRIISQA